MILILYVNNKKCRCFYLQGLTPNYEHAQIK